MTSLAYTGRAALAALLCVTCACADRPLPPLPRPPPKLDAVKKIGIMPVEGTVTRIVFTGENEELGANVEVATIAVTESLQRVLAAHGFESELIALDEALFAEKPELRFAATQLQQTADTQIPTAIDTGSSPGVHALLSEADQLAALVDADVLLFARYIGFTKSGGEVAKDVLLTIVAFVFTLGGLYIRPKSGGMVAIWAVDASTGEQLYIGSAGSRTSDTSSPAALAEIALAQFERN